MLTQQVSAGRDVPRTWMVVLAPGDNATECLLGFVREQRLASASFVAVGAFERAVIAYFDWEKKAYQHIPVDQQVEVASFIGDVVPDEHGTYVLHAHVVLGLPDGSTKGGHLIEGYVRPTLEVTLTETPANLVRRIRPDVGLAVIDAR